MKTPGSGRKPGSLNKLTSTIKGEFEHVFRELQKEEGVNLFQWGKSNPTEFYKLSSKIIPSEINANLSGAVKVNGTINFIRPDNNVPS
jgi:hypothetical protein